MPGVLVTALGANPDGDGTLLRLWEQAGGSGECRVRLPGAAFTRAQPVDQRGRPSGAALPIRNGEFSVAVRASAPLSLILER